MNILRRFMIGLCAAVFFGASIFLAWSHVLTTTLRNRDNLKEWLTEGTVYENVVQVALDGLANSEQQGQGEIPASDPALQARLKQVLTPSYLQTNVESVIDGVYNWLEGDAAKPDFAIDVSQLKSQVADSLGQYAAERAATLPVCTSVPADYNELSADCIPPGVAPAQIQAAVQQQVTSGDFLSDQVITAEDIKSADDTDKDIFAELAQAKQAYQLSGAVPIVLAIVVLLSAAGIIFLSSSRRAGVLRLGITSVFVTLVLGGAYIALQQGPSLIERAFLSNAAAGSAAGQALVVNISKAFAGDVRTLMGYYALGYLLLTITCFVLYVVLGRRQTPNTPASTDPTPPIDDSPKQVVQAKESNEDTPKEEPTKQKAPRKIDL